MANELNSLFFFGRPLGPLYGLIMKFRELLYTKQVFKQENPGAPVISVGNLVLGGTGKTPTVIHLAQMLQAAGLKPAVISRGYGGKSKATVNVVSDGKSILMDATSAGDEPILIAQSLVGVPVVTGKKRIFPARYAVDHLGANIILLDDGFQHMAVSRDINLVLFDASALAGNSRIFPGGPLREPVAALKRTSAFLITGQNKENKKRSDLFGALLQERFPEIPLYVSVLSESIVVDQAENRVNVTGIKDAYAFCAIAQPDRVQSTLSDLGINLVGCKAYQDHSPYDQQVITALCSQATEKKARCLITTAKDFVKIKEYHFTLPLFVLQIKQQPESAFNDYILKNIPCKR